MIFYIRLAAGYLMAGIVGLLLCKAIAAIWFLDVPVAAAMVAAATGVAFAAYLTLPARAVQPEERKP